MLLTKFEPIDAQTLSITPLPPVRWLIPDLLPAGLALLAGASKSGKSWLCLWLGLQLAQGGEFWGRAVPARTVLYLCLEDTYARIQNRLFRLTEDTAPDRLYFQTACEAIGQGLERQIETFLTRHPETGLVIIDTLQKVREADPTTGIYASDYQDIQADRAKTKSSLRTLPLVEGFAQRLRALKEQQKYNEKLCGNCYNQKFKGYLFVDEMGNLILPNTVTDNFAQLLKEHGLRKIRFHDLRHSCASLLLKQGVPMKQIQEWLGHSDISTTANIYAHLDSQSKQLSAATMEKALALPAELPESRW